MRQRHRRPGCSRQSTRVFDTGRHFFSSRWLLRRDLARRRCDRTLPRFDNGQEPPALRSSPHQWSQRDSRRVLLMGVCRADNDREADDRAALTYRRRCQPVADVGASTLPGDAAMLGTGELSVAVEVTSAAGRLASCVDEDAGCRRASRRVPWSRAWRSGSPAGARCRESWRRLGSTFPNGAASVP